MIEATADRMTEALLIGTTFGIAAGLVPGPFVAYVAATAMDRGLRAGLRVALAPLAVETPVMLLTVLVLAQVPDGVLRWVGILGGAAIALLGVHALRRAGETEVFGRPEEEGDVGTRHFFGLVGAGLLSPAPWVFWAALGGPLLLRYWNRGPAAAGAFVASFFALFVGGQMLVAFGASRGVRLLERKWRRRALRGLGLLLVVAGALLAWQAWTGDFGKAIQAKEQVEELVR